MMSKHFYSALVGIIGAGLLFLPAMAGAESRSEANSFGIVPKPFSIEARKEKPFVINAATSIVYQGEASKPAAEYLQEWIAASTGLQLAVRDSGDANEIVLRVAPERVEFDEKDAYTFESGGENITITGKSASGLFYGVQTLFQLLPPGIYSDTPVANMTLTVDALTIQDKPSMGKIRGLHVDIARHFRTKEELKKIIDSMAMHKLNTLHLHLSDDEGWRVEIKAYPKLTSVGAIGNKSDPTAPAAFLTQGDIIELCAYAERRHVAIIPEIDMPGHMGAVIKAYPELKHPKEERDPAKVIRGDATARDFAKKLLTEINSLFDPEYIHIGLDEVSLKSPDACIDGEGTLRLGWWKGNEKMKRVPIAVQSPGDASKAIAMLDQVFDTSKGIILEGTLRLPKGEGEQRSGLYIECGNREGAGVLIDYSGVAELGSIQADGEDLKIVERNKRGKEQNPKRVDRQMTFANPAKFRLLLKGPLMEFYLGDILIESFALPANATGRIGLINSAETLGTLKAWE